MAFKYEITEVLGVMTQTEEEQEHLRWCKAVLETVLTKDGSELDGIDIRRFNNETKQMGNVGIRLTKEEAGKMVNILLERGYGDFDILEKEYKKRLSLFEG